MKSEVLAGVPDHDCYEFKQKTHEYCLMIPVLNESGRLQPELNRALKNGVFEICDIIILDGGSTDNGAERKYLESLGVNTLLIKTGAGKQSAQLRMGFYFAVNRGYKGIVTIDGNNKDSIERTALFIKKLEEGYDFVQGSRFLPGGGSKHTPFLRYISVRLIHAPLISKAAGYKFTDTTNAFRGYSVKYLTHPQVKIFREVFNSYELLAYLSVRASQIGLKSIEIPVIRNYPKKGVNPTKISPVKGNIEIFRILINTIKGKYNPKDISDGGL